MNEKQLALIDQEQYSILAEAIRTNGPSTAIVPASIVEQRQGHIRVAGEIQSSTELVRIASRIPKRVLVYRLLSELWDVYLEDVASLVGLNKNTIHKYKNDMREAGMAPEWDGGEDQEWRSLIGDVVRRQTSRVARQVDITDPGVFDEDEAAILKPLYDVLDSEWELPAHNERSIYKVITKSSDSDKTRQSRISTFTAFARYMKFDSLDAYPWEQMKTSAIAEAIHFVEQSRPHFYRGEPRKISSIASGWTDHMTLFEQLTNDGIMEEQEYSKIKRISKRNNWGSRKGSPIAKAPVIAVDKWLDIVRTVDLRTDRGWQLLAMLCTLFPLGMRPADSYMTMKSHIKLDEGYFRAYRTKTDFEGPVMVDVFPAVRAVFEKWLSIIPEDKEHLWYALSRGKSVDGLPKGAICWELPVRTSIRAGSIVGGQTRYHVLNRCGYEVEAWVPKSGRASYETACATTPSISKAVTKMQSGRKGQGSEWEYIEIAVEMMRGEFGKVEELMEFDAGLAEVIAPALSGDIAPYKLRICVDPGCDEILSGRQKKYHNGACKQKGHRLGL